jgi:hypothetical protein
MPIFHLTLPAFPIAEGPENPPEAIPERFQERAPDGGPFYVETPDDLADFRGIAEPYNTVTATFFLLIALFWLFHLRGRYRKHPVLTLCLPLLLAGGIGGTLYHGLRSWVGYFLLDVVPIYVLGMVVTVSLWIKIGPNWKHLLGMIGFVSFLQLVGHLKLPKHWAINLSYAFMALLILTPIVFALIRTRFAHAGWVATALVAFAIAWFFRLADNTFWPPILPMGTHWLWHTFGAVSTLALSVYMYRIENITLRVRNASSSESGVRNAE